MAVRGVIIVFVCTLCAQVSLSLEQQCRVVVLRNSTDPVEVSFFNRMEQLFKEKKLVETISAYLKTGRVNVSIMFSIDHNNSQVTVKLENITLTTNSNYSDPDFFEPKYRDVNTTKVLIKLKNVFIEQGSTDIYNTIISDKIIMTYLQKVINDRSLMNVNTTVTAQGFHFNFIELHYVGKEHCFLSYDGNSTQRHRRSADSERKFELSKRSIFDEGLTVPPPEDFHPMLYNKRLPIKNKRIFYPGIDNGYTTRTSEHLPISGDSVIYGVRRSRPADDDCSNKRSGKIISVAKNYKRADLCEYDDGIQNESQNRMWSSIFGG